MVVTSIPCFSVDSPTLSVFVDVVAEILEVALRLLNGFAFAILRERNNDKITPPR